MTDREPGRSELPLESAIATSPHPELNYRLGLLSAAATAKSADLRVDYLFNTIEDIRRQNSASPCVDSTTVDS